MNGARRLPHVAAVPAFFGVKVLCALLLLKLSSARLPVAEFAIFSQFFLFSALINMIAVGGSQNGVIRSAAMAQGDGDTARLRDGAYLIWLVAAALAGVPLAIASPLVADLMTSKPEYWATVVLILALNFAGGPGQIWCSLLTGRGRVPASIAAQLVGVLAGTACAALFLLRGDPLKAAIGYSLGPLAMSLAAALPMRRLRLPAPDLAAGRPEARKLVHYSGAFLVLAVVTPTALFALRGLYQDLFGMGLLGYWLTASRISDTTTQLLALFLVQYFLPGLARTPPGSPEARSLVLRSCLLGAAGMALIPVVFSLAPRFFVDTFLAPEYEPAIPFILAYMLGDVARVWSAVAMQATFARGRLGLYIGIELGTIALMGAILVPLSLAGDTRAPVIAYALAYGLAAIAISVAFVRARRAIAAGTGAAPPS